MDAMDEQPLHLQRDMTHGTFRRYLEARKELAELASVLIVGALPLDATGFFIWGDSHRGRRRPRAGAQRESVGAIAAGERLASHTPEHGRQLASRPACRRRAWGARVL